MRFFVAENVRSGGAVETESLAESEAINECMGRTFCRMLQVHADSQWVVLRLIHPATEVLPSF